MIVMVLGLWTFLRALVVDAAAVSLENLALGSQLAVLQRSVPRPKVYRRDRGSTLLGLALTPLDRLAVDLGLRPARDSPRTASKGLSALLALEVPTPIQGTSSNRPGTSQPHAPHGQREPHLGRRRIQAELRFLGYEVAELTIARYMRRRSPRLSPSWRAFLATHRHEIAAVDFFVVPTLTFRLLFGFVVLRHRLRELLHVNVTDHPTAAWAAQQLVETSPEETTPKHLLRDRDAIYGDVFARRLKGMGIHEVLIAPRAPWQNPFAERVIGSIRRECLDHLIVFNEQHLRRLLRGYLAYYNATRPHQSLHSDSPYPREVQPPASGRILAIPQVGGLHHRYKRVA